MKKKIKIRGFDGKETVIEKEQRNLDHLKSQQTYKSKLFKNRKKYNRKKKYAEKYDI